MLNALFSIKPRYAECILSNMKKFEFRTSVCKQIIDKIIIYETFPVCKIVGEVSVVEILKNSPNIIWQITKDYAGISAEKFNEYFKDREMAFAYVLTNPIRYKTPKILQEIGIKKAPQSFLYLSDVQYILMKSH